MECSKELLREIQTAVEGVEYGSVEITLAEKGPFVEIIVKNKKRIQKEEIQEYHRG
jgi:hypothetical protein